MTLFARCINDHWNALTEKPISGDSRYCGQCNQLIVEAPSEPPQYLSTFPCAQVVSPYRWCSQGHLNDLSGGAHWLTLGCGNVDCRSPLITSEGPAKAALEPQIYKPHIMANAFWILTCHSDHLCYINSSTAPTVFLNFACGHDGCFNPIKACTPLTKSTVLPLRVPAVRQFDFETNLNRLQANLISIDKTIKHAQYSQVCDVDLANPLVFSELCKYSVHKFTGSTAKVRILFNDIPHAELAVPHFFNDSPLHPYCYPLKSNGIRQTQNVRYEDIGLQLTYYNPDFIDILLTVAIRVVKMKHTQSDLDSINIASPYILAAPLPYVGAAWSPISLLATLVGSAACETGRGVVGFVNVLAAFRHLKHDNRAIWNQWAISVEHNPILAKTQAVRAVYPNTYEFNGSEARRNAVGFGGSEALIKKASGQSVTLYTNSLAHKDAYNNFVRRDITLMATARTPNYPTMPPRSTTHDHETLDQTFEIKILRYLRIIFPS